MLGKVKAVRMTRSGLVLIFCASADQKERALCLNQLDTFEVLCVSLRNRTTLKGVTSGVSWEVYFEEMKNIPRVIEARRMNRVLKSEESICSFVFLIWSLSLLKCS